MKTKNILLLCVLSSTLIACGSGGSGGSSSTSDSKLPYSYKVPNHLKDAVETALKIDVDWEPAKGYNPLTINNNKYEKGDIAELSQFNLGYSENTYTLTNKDIIQKGLLKVYRMPYSLIFSLIADKGSVKLSSENDGTAPDKYNDIMAFKPGYTGYYTDNMPEVGKTTYLGKAFVGNEVGEFNLDVDFGDSKSVSGKITNLAKGDIILEKGEIKPVSIGGSDVKKMGFIGNATLSGDYAYLIKEYVGSKDGTVTEDDGYSYNYHKYSGHFFGEKAEEVAGTVYGSDETGYHDDELAAFGGQRGEIQK